MTTTGYEDVKRMNNSGEDVKFAAPTQRENAKRKATSVRGDVERKATARGEYTKSSRTTGDGNTDFGRPTAARCV